MGPRLYTIDRLTLLLLVVALALFGLQRLGQSTLPPLTQQTPDAVQEIRILKRGKLQLGLLRDNAGWMLTHPSIARARAARVERLLALLRAPSLRSWPVSPGLLIRSGLERPARSIRFDHLSIDFGGPSAPPGQRYVRVAGRIHLVDELWFSLTGLPASYYSEEH